MGFWHPAYLDILSDCLGSPSGWATPAFDSCSTYTKDCTSSYISPHVFIFLIGYSGMRQKRKATRKSSFSGNGSCLLLVKGHFWNQPASFPAPKAVCSTEDGKTAFKKVKSPKS